VSFRILSYNIRRGGAGREGAIAAVIRTVSPDIVVFEEATRPDVVECVARETGMAHGRRGRENRSHS
jgi:endonuclease/exonuclease/phosphatase family metal-dependent hydrolase